MKKYSISIFFLLFCGVAQAESIFSLPDPTLPYQWAVIKDEAAPVMGAAGVAPQSKNELVLSSIVYAPDRRFVLINGQMMREGDLINNVKVIQITPRSVKVKQANKVMTLTLQNISENQSLKIIRR